MSLSYIVNPGCCCSLDPSNVRVREGMERVEKQNDMGLESAYDVGVEDMENSEEEVRQI